MLYYFLSGISFKSSVTIRANCFIGVELLYKLVIQFRVLNMKFEEDLNDVSFSHLQSNNFLKDTLFKWFKLLHFTADPISATS